MSEEAIKNALGMNAEQEDIDNKTVDTGNATTEQEVEQEAISPLMQEALAAGYKDKDAFVKAGGDPDKHVSPHEFVRYGKLQKAMQEQRRRFEEKEHEFDQRIENLNRLHDAQLEQKLADLRAKQRAAVEDADGEAFDQAQAQIDTLSKQKQEVQTPAAPTTPAKDPAIIAWEEKNPWVNDPSDPRAGAAKGIWATFVNDPKNANATVEQALAYVDTQMAKLVPTGNPLRDMPSAAETGARPAPRSKALSMSDLTSDERELWRSAGHAIWKGDEKAFLKSVSDSRK